MTFFDPGELRQEAEAASAGTLFAGNHKKGRSPRAKLADRFDEELAIAIVDDQAKGRHTAVFLLEVDLVELKIWDETAGGVPPEISETIARGISNIASNIACSVVAQGSFVGFAKDLPGSAAITSLSKSIVEALRSPIVVNGILNHMSARLGVANVDSAAHPAGEALDNARLAIETTTETNPYAIYTPTMARRRAEDASLEYDFKLALSGGVIDVVFQPILSLNENRIAGVEAFARWTHPDLGEILPSQFLNIAERSGTIRQLGQQVLVKAMDAANKWAEHEELTNIILWVNFSPTEIAYPDFEPTIRQIIQQYPRVQLGLELAESSVIEERVISSTLKHLRAFGVRTSVDDFSSKDTAVARLRALPFDNIKIGRDLVRALPASQDDQAVVQLLCELGRRSGFSVSAVGVETEEELSLLRRLGVESAQGYFLARPATAHEVDTLLVATLATH